MNIDEEEFQDEFSTFGVSLDSEDIISKLRELCQRYRLDADQIAMEWVAFSNSRGNCKLNFETLDLLDRERLSKKAKKGVTPASTKKKMGKGTVHNLDTIEAAIVESNSILDAYSTPNGKSINKRLHTTPENPVNKRLTGLNGTPATPFSPRSFSPARSAETPSKKYSVRTNAGEVLSTFGPQNVEWKLKRDSPVPVNVLQYDPSSSVTQRYKYMFQKLVDKATALNDMIDDIGAYIQKEHKIEDYSHVSLPAQEEVTVVGRICCDSQGKLNAKSVLLEGSRRTSASKQIAVDLSELKQYALFPGQVVAMTGLNTNGNKFVAKKFHESVPLPLPSENLKLAAEEPLSLLIAAGPYSTSDNLTYEPLADLIKIIKRESPNVCILMGPILDIKNPEVENCRLAEPFEERFQIIVDQIRNFTADLHTRLVFVPSYRDVHHDPIYPQPPYNQKNDDRVHYVSDPCVLSVNGIVVGITSTDVLLHLGTEDISFPPGSSDRLARLTSHLLNQRSFYPLYPPTDEMNIDYPHHEHYGVMPVTPHVLVVPSDLRYFVKDINGCCCVNPGRLAKGQIGGTFAKLMVNPSAENKPLIERISAQVVRI